LITHSTQLTHSTIEGLPMLRSFLPIRALRWLALLLALFPLLLCAATSTDAGTTDVGFRAISMRDPVGGGSMPGYVFYPSAQASGTTWRGPYELAATADAPALPGARPLIVLSHGNGGDDLGHHDLATYLASHGFVVATLEHPKDNFHDKSGVGHAEVLGGRALQVSATISAVLADPQWKQLVDAQRIGVAGFSAGGYTSLLMVGARPRFDRFIDFCRRHPHDDPDICGNAEQVEQQLARHKLTIEQYFAQLQKDFDRLDPTADRRVKAAFVMAPLSLIFDQAGIATINRPVFLYYGSNDHVLLPPDNAAQIRPWIRTLTGYKVVPGADHWVFLAPCSAQLAKELPTICSDPPGVDRVAVHKQIGADAVAFFRKTLAAPTP
jgi:predicted dienelactone hydrolase